MQTDITRKPTARMFDVAAAIQASRKTSGQAPSYREIARELRVSLGRVVELCRKARDRGLIDYVQGEPRSFRVLDPRRVARHAKAQGRQ